MENRTLGVWVTAIINIFISIFILAGIFLMAWNLYHFLTKILGLAYAKEISEYVNGFTHYFKNKKSVGPQDIENLQKLVNALNANLGDHKITLSHSLSPQENFQHVNDAIQDLIKNEETQHTFFKAIIQLVKDKNEVLNGIQPINDKHVEFAKSLFEFSDYVSFKKIAALALKDTVDKKGIVNLLVEGMFKWFTQTSGWFFIGLLMFAVGWLSATVASITTKIVRKKRDLKGGGWLIFWAWFMPLFGFIFYPIISFSYILRKKA
ncbi:hypothetical protein [Mycoplasma todarodis]|uniref:Uncharacterized protein n=1 Tax=Mycoplasma todarodis TaxID=1937191 RepID=A0A4R0XPV9_9MOLU|nr:hypothetical protein [Mycoplasma todarodis]TCG11592.1 hypothetical protein C4B25_01260 [Mycoplasma todarodis]